MLEGRSLHKVYSRGQSQVSAVVDLSLHVAPGEFLAVCGRSGSGKSTLLGMLGGLCRPSQGTVILDGVDVWSRAADALAELRNRRIGFLFQFASLLPALRAIDNVALPALLGGVTAFAAAYARAEALLHQVGLASRLDAYPGELSGGEQRRVALARALINRPSLLLADEPTSDLDEDSEAEMLELLRDLQRAQQTTLVVVTHNSDIARQADRVVHLRNGRLASTSRAERSLPDAVRLPEDGAAAAVPASTTVAPAPPVPLGAGLGRFLVGFASWMVLVVFGILALNQGASVFQHRSLAQKQSARKNLEAAALQQLQADIENLACEPDGTYRLTLSLENLDPERDLFVLAPSVHVHIQVERSWVEVPSRSCDRQEGRVVRVTGKQRFEFVFKPEVKSFEEQIAGYMHVRVSNAMLLSRSSEPRDDLFDRTDAYYVYLKPAHADDAEILRRNQWSGKPPLWIPMPPH